MYILPEPALRFRPWLPVLRPPACRVSMEEPDQGEVATISRRWAQYPSVRAVADGRVFGHGGFLLLRPGPRLAEQAILMGLYLHPK